MNGIERLRAIAVAWDEWGLGGTLADMADQIERELARQDEPDSTDKGARLLYVTDEDREALEWVRNYGGAGCVQTMAAKLGDTLNWIRERAGIGEDEVVDYDELLDALDRRLMPEGCKWPRYESGELVGFGDEYVNAKGNVSTLRTIVIKDCRDRLGGGYYWKLGKGACAVMVKNGERIKRPAVLAADGEPLEVGQTVWRIDTGAEYWVKSGQTITSDAVVIIRKTDCDCESEIVKASQLTHQRPALDAEGNRIEPAMDVWWVCEGDERGVHAERLHVESIGEDGLVTCDPFNGGTWVELEPSELYVKKPVLDADGVPIKKGDTVWDTDAEADTPLTVVEVSSDLVRCEYTWKDGKTYRPCYPPDQLTHTKPEIDSWEKLKSDIYKEIEMQPTLRTTKFGIELFVSEVERRARALSKKENRNE